MRGTPKLAWLGVLLILLLPLPLGQAALEPLPPSPGGSPSEIAYHVVRSKLASGPIFLEKEGDTLALVKDQMAAIVLLLDRSQRLQESADTLRTDAAATWEAAEAAYNAAAGYYSVRLEAASLCIDWATNAWALRAASALAVHVDPEAYTQRADALRGALTDLLASGQHAGLSFCPYDPQRPHDAARPRDLNHVPIVLLALLEDYPRRPDTNTESVVQATLAQLQRDHLDQAFHDAQGVFPAMANAQLLIVLDQAATLLAGDDHAPERANLTRFLIERTLQRVPDGPWGVTVARNANGTFETIGEPNAPTQWWIAYALHNHRTLSPQDVPPGLPAELVAAATQYFWSYPRGGFISRGSREDNLIHFEPNALAAQVLSGPLLVAVQRERPDLRVAVPQRADFTYPRLDDANAERYYLRNQWEFRFSVHAPATGTYRAVLPGAALGPLNASFPVTPYTPEPLLRQATQQLTGQFLGGADPILAFNANLQVGNNPLRLTAYAPILPRTSSLTDGLHLVVHSHAPQTLELQRIYVEIEATQVDVLEVRLNDATLPPARVGLEGPLTTQAIPEPHLGIELRDVALRPGDNEVLILVKDVVSPTLTGVQLSRDEAGRQTLQPGATGKYKVTNTDTTWVRAVARDNLGLRQVFLRATHPDDPSNATEVRMAAHPSEPHVFLATLPRFRQTGETRLEVVAIDQHNNQNPYVEPLSVDVGSPFLGGSLVLFAFSLVLFGAALAIYVKMGRRAP